MMRDLHRLVDAVESDEFERFLFKCFAPLPYRKYSRRQRYLEQSIPRGFHKILLVFNGDVVGQIEYAPAEASYYPISGDKVIVMNCIWVLRKVRGHNFGKLLINQMIKNERTQLVLQP